MNLLSRLSVSSGLLPAQVLALAEQPEYRSKRLPKRGPGTRPVHAPSTAQRALLEAALAELKDLPVHEAAHGFVPGRSTATCAAMHVAPKVLVTLDLSDWYGSIDDKRIWATLVASAWDPHDVVSLADAALLAKLLTVPVAGEPAGRVLPQGAATSPVVANAVAYSMDQSLTLLALRQDWVYTRYADDLAFSSQLARSRAAIGGFVANAGHIIQRAGFKVNRKKTCIARPHQLQAVAGFTVNGGTPRPLRAFMRRLRAAIHNYKRGRPSWNYKQLRGAVAYVQMVDKERAERLLEELEGCGG